MFRLIDGARRLADAARSISPTTRRYLYRVVSATAALAATVLVVDGEAVGAALYLVSIVLGVADTNVVPPNRPHEVDEV